MPTADELIGQDAIDSLITTISRAAPAATLDTVKAARTRLASLSLRERSDLLKDALLRDLPGDFDQLEAILRQALTDDDFRGRST